MFTAVDVSLEIYGDSYLKTEAIILLASTEKGESNDGRGEVNNLLYKKNKKNFNYLLTIKCLNLEWERVENLLDYLVEEERAMIPIISHPNLYSSGRGID